MDPLLPPFPQDPLYYRDDSPKELLLPDIIATAGNINLFSLPPSTQLPPPLLSPRPHHPSITDFISRFTAQDELPLLSHTHGDNSKDYSIAPNVRSPADLISCPTEPSQGYGRLRHLDRMKREQYIQNAHESLTVKWDMVDLGSIISVLEACGNDLQKAQEPLMNEQDRSDAQTTLSTDGNGNGDSLQQPQQDQASKFDPRAPHFDVILVDLTNAPTETYQGIREDTEQDTTTSESGPGLDLPTERSRLDGSLGLKDPYNLKLTDQPTSGLSIGTPNNVVKAKDLRKDINDLPMESLAGRPGWLFLWLGNTDNMVDGRRILGKFGFRKVECIGWMRTTSGDWIKVNTNQSDDNIQHLSEATGRGVLRSGIEWCLVGVKGTAKRTYDSHLIHCNVSTDVMVCDGPEAPKSSLLSRIIENFSQGQRRLHLFAKPGDERPGWVCVGKDFEETTFDCKKYMKFWDDKGKHGWLMPYDPEIEYFRPKTPPVQVRKRERAGVVKRSSQSGTNSRGARWEDELPKFPHPGQRKEPIVRYFFPEDDPKYQKKVTTTSNITNGSGSLAPGYINGHKPVMGSRVTQLSGTAPKLRANNQNSQSQYTNPQHNQFQNLQQRSLGPLMKPSGPGGEIRPSPTTRHFRPKDPSQGNPEPIRQSGPLDVRPDGFHISRPPIAQSYGYTYQPTRQLPNPLSKVSSIQSIPSTTSASPDTDYQQYIRKTQPFPIPQSYPSTNPSSLSSQFEALSIYSDSRQSESPPPYSNPPPDYPARGFVPPNLHIGGPGGIRTANAARLATLPPVFRTEYRQSQRQSGLLSGYYGNVNPQTDNSPEDLLFQRKFTMPSGYGPMNSAEYGGSNSLDRHGPSQQVPYHQQLPTHNIAPKIHLNQRPLYQSPQGPQVGGYPSTYMQPQLQPQLLQIQQIQQIPNVPYPGHEFYLQQNHQNQLQRPGQYGTCEFPNQQQQQNPNILHNLWLIQRQADYEPQVMVASTQGPLTFL